jgi:ACS family hexuronate transporter-like MFS transporter
VWWFYLFWLPKYLSDVHGFTLAHIGALAWLPYLAADIGAISGGALSGYLIRRGWTVLGARAGGMWPFAAVMPVSLLLPFTHSAPLAIVIICVVAFSHIAWRTNLSTCTNDLYAPSIVGSAAGLLAFGSGLGGTLFTSLTGHIVQNFSYGAVFVIMGFLHPLAFLIFRLLVRAPEET